MYLKEYRNELQDSFYNLMGEQEPKNIDFLNFSEVISEAYHGEHLNISINLSS